LTNILKYGYETPLNLLEMEGKSAMFKSKYILHYPKMTALLSSAINIFE